MSLSPADVQDPTKEGHADSKNFDRVRYRGGPFPGKEGADRVCRESFVTNQDLWNRARNIFIEALDHDGNSRQGFIESRCGADIELTKAVWQLLAGHETEGLVDELAIDDGGLAAVQDRIKAMAPGDIQPGDAVGAFEILGKLGEGGMATVYRAKRVTDDFEQEVALKIVSSHRLTEDAVVRFTFERQIAASLDHPNIAKLVDGGLTDDGRPFFALDLVDGEEVTTYCDQNELSVPDRVRLVIEIASAVHYAHRNLLVHRDLKPSNILVDATGRVRLLDFGIAKPLDPEMTGSARTQTGDRLLTPRYASPEQFIGASITTASDQYQLGLLLYELVTGHCHHLLDGDDPASMGRRITDVDTPRPSRLFGRSTTTSDAASEHTVDNIARLRQVDTGELGRLLRGDLDTIILKTLEKDPNRRYSSVEALADDLQRYLNDEPVHARPQSLGYQASKFFRRHRLAVAAAGLGFLALVIGTGVASWQAVRATRAEALALEEAATATQVSEFLVGLFKEADPGLTGGRTPDAAEILNRGRERLNTELQDQPMVRGRLLRALSQIFHHLSDLDSALDLGNEALAVHQQAEGFDSLEVAADLHNLAEIHTYLGHAQKAQELYQHGLDIRVSILGRRSVEAAQSLAGIGRSLGRQGKNQEALSYQREALEIRLEHLDRLSAPVAHSTYYVGFTLSRVGEYEQALEMFQEAAAIDREVFGRESRDYAEDLAKIASTFWRMGRYEESIASARESISIAQSIYGDQHHVSLRGLEPLALNLIELAQYEEAEQLMQKAVAGTRMVYGERSDDMGGTLHNYGYLLQDMGRFEEAEPIYNEAISIRTDWLGAEHPSVAELRENLAEVWLELGRVDEAEAGFRRALRDKEASLDADNPRMSWPHWGLGLTLWHKGQLNAAEASLQKARTILETKLGPDHPDLAYSLHILANVKRDQGEAVGAEELYKKALELRSGISNDRLLYRRTVEDYAELLRRTGRTDQAEELIEQLPPL